MATKFIYTESDVKEILVKYAEGVSLETLAEQYTKSVASVRMKLVKLGVYKKAETTKVADNKATVQAAEFPKTKAGILAHFNTAMSLVGPALF